VAQANHLAYLLFVVSFCFFTWSLLGMKVSRLFIYLIIINTFFIFCFVLIIDEWSHLHLIGSIITLIFWFNCLLVVWRSVCRPDIEQRIVAACLLLIVVVGIRDALGLLDLYSTRYFYTPYTCLLFLMTAGLILGRRVAKNAQRIDLFNQELQQAVVLACKELEATMKVEHQKLLEQSRQQERLQLAHNLHDGVGGQLVRSMLAVEQAQSQMDKSQVLSMLKILRDDLRQTIDQGASSALTTPKTVTEWAAPLRQRFGNLMDQLGMSLDWELPNMWVIQPTADQCVVMARIVEEALTNCLKHSEANSVKVVMEYRYLDQHQLLLSIIDDGKGFDITVLPETGLNVGLLSMRKRLSTIGGQLLLYSRPGNTCIQASIPLNQNP
jgi:two-component system, NarL family, sensor histidine kinase UhpB